MLEGCFTAIVTPFISTGLKSPVDWEAFDKLLSFQKEEGVTGIVACGTTGESPVLSHEEHSRVIQFTVENFGDITIAGTGSNSTWEAVELTKHAEDAGANASLQVCPYYNKPNQEGLFRHFGEVAEAVDIPILLYNVPGRTAREIAPETMARLAEEYSNVIGVKEASGREDIWRRIRENCGENFLILSGNDGDTFRLMKDYAAKGVVSVASNVIPGRIAKYVKMGLEGRFDEMQKEDRMLSEFFEALFIDTNPIPVKEAMNICNINAGGFRLPLCEMEDEKKEQLRNALSGIGLL
jgi:4-hydroxy-tetrahydrodipicolinate synthase